MTDTKPQTTNGIRYLCENIRETTFKSPDGKFLIHVGYETVNHENHRRDKFNPNHIDHYFRTTDKITGVTIEAIND